VVFAGGEVVSGPSSVVEAVAHGRCAASEIDKYLGGDGDILVPLVDDGGPDMQLDGDTSFARLLNRMLSDCSWRVCCMT